MTTPFERSAREWLRESAESLDGRTRSRLNRARQAALTELDPKARRLRWLSSPVMAAGGAAAVALVLWWSPGTRPGGHPGPGQPTAAQVVAAIDDAELAPVGGEGLLDADPTLFALAAVPEKHP